MKLITYLIYWIFLPGTCFAEATPPLSIGVAVEHALERNPDLLRAKEALSQSQEDYRTAIGKALPTVSAQANGAYQKDSALLNFPNFGGEAYNQYQVYLSLNQPLYVGGAITAGLHSAEKNREIQKYALEIAERTLTESVITNYFSVLLNQRLYDILQDTYQLNKQTLAIAERYFKIGRAQKLDVLQLQTQTAQLLPQIAQAENTVRASAAQLATLLRDLDANSIHINGALVSPDPQWVHEMMSKKSPELPEVLQSRLLVDQASDNTTVQLAQYWPKLSLVGQMGRVSYAKTDLLEDAATSWNIGLQFSVPIFNGLSSISQSKSLRSQEKQLEYAETKAADTASVNQIQTDKDLRVAESSLQTSKDAANWGKESLKEAERQYRLQQINYLQYQTSIQAYLTSQNLYYQAKYNYIVAIAKYFEANGISLSYLVTELNRLSQSAKET